MIGLLLGNWKLVAVGLLVAALGVQTYRLQGAHAQLEVIAAQGEAAREVARFVNRQSDVITRKVEADAQARERARERAVADLRRQLRDARTSVVPDAAGSTGSGDGVGGRDGAVCFAGGRLRAGVDAALARFAGGLEALVSRGADAVDVLETCATWAMTQDKLRRPTVDEAD